MSDAQFFLEDLREARETIRLVLCNWYLCDQDDDLDGYKVDGVYYCEYHADAVFEAKRKWAEDGERQMWWMYTDD